MLNFVEKVSFGKSDYVVTYKGKAGQGQDFFAYIICNAKSYAEMKSDYENQVNVPDIRKYGEVLYMRFEKEPDDSARLILDTILKSRPVK